MAEHPHCNAEVLHAPGECYVCDKYPERQAMRKAGKTPFTPNESNGWSGNVAAPAGSVHSHMGFTYIVGWEDTTEGGVMGTPWDDDDKPCEIHFKRGWRCTRGRHAVGPCALVPEWWNVIDRWRFK